MLERLSQLKDFAVESFSKTVNESFDFANMVAKRVMEMKNSMVDSLKNLVNKSDSLVKDSMTVDFQNAMKTKESMGQQETISFRMG
jgi:hypothetical protein